MFIKNVYIQYSNSCSKYNPAIDSGFVPIQRGGGGVFKKGLFKELKSKRKIPILF